MAGALVGGAFLSASLQVLFDRLASREVVNFIRGHNLKDALLKKLKRKLLTVQAVLNDAEAKQITNPAVKDWMDELKVVVYDAEDVLDEIATEDLRCKIEAADSQPSMSTWVHPSFDVQSINSRVEEIINRLEDIVQDRDVLGLKEGIGEKLAQRWPSTSLVDESLVYGRDEIKEEIIQLLLSDNARSTDAIGVISIVGMGGTGKTTLAQLLYNDQRVKDRFDLKAWVCVSEEFDPIRVTKTILETINSSKSDTTDLNLLQVQLKESINMQKFLLVLDDVWNEDSCDWDKLQTPLKVGAMGSKIIVTTRSTNVAFAMRAVQTRCLDGLSLENGWSLFTKLAFENGDSSRHPQLEAIGKKIVCKCQGLPLAIKAMGSLLHSKAEVRDWDDVLNSELWDLPTDAVLPALRLSYYYLPSHLKRCFSYCSIFPKDYEFNKEKLVLLWMAEGLLEQSKSKKRVKEVGDLYFEELLSKSFFQNSIRNESYFIMHDLLNDLAQLVSGEFSISLEDDKIYKVSEKTRHLSYLISQYDVCERFGPLFQMKCLRTFLPRSQSSHKYLSNRILHHLLPEMKCLRVLCLSNYNIIDLPHSIDKLKHLRYLDLSYTMIPKVPESVCNLYNLQTIMLMGCYYLVELPSRMEKLINLRYLDIRDTLVKELPCDLCKLKNLQSLSTFIVGQNRGLRLEALRELSGSLFIKLENVVCGRDSLKANMKDKKYLNGLTLEWDHKNTSGGGVVQNERDILSSLQPHTNLKRLHIKSFGGFRFPDWVGDPSFFYLVALKLEDCSNCSSLPPLGQLPSLKHLRISRMIGVKRVGSEFYYSGNASSSKPFFPCLQTLHFEEMHNWVKWIRSLCCGCRRGEFPRLQELYIRDCPKLIGKLPRQLPSLKKLGIYSCGSLVGSLLAPEISEWNMQIHGKFQLKRPACGFTNLQTSEIEISDISQWEELPEELPPRIKKLSFRECDSIGWVLQKGMLQRSTCLLQRLDITSCRFFTDLHRVGLPTALKSLHISKCTKLKFLLHRLLRSHHPFLEHLSIEDSSSRNPLPLSFSLSFFPRLNSLNISDFEGLKFLSISILGGNPTSLNHLYIRECPDLIYIKLPALESASYEISGCRKLKLLAHTLSSLESLSLFDCPELLFHKAGLPSNLRELQISLCNQLTSQVDWGLRRLASLIDFKIRNGCRDMESFPNEYLLPSSLTSLSIRDLPNLKSLDSKGLQHLTSLTTLSIFNCSKFQSFGEEGLQHLTTLEKLNIESLPSLREVGLQYLTSLKELSISLCHQLQYLTKGRLPNSLSCLRIRSCPLLEKGQDWEYIAQNIRHIIINDVLY